MYGFPNPPLVYGALPVSDKEQAPLGPLGVGRSLNRRVGMVVAIYVCVCGRAYRFPREAN